MYLLYIPLFYRAYYGTRTISVRFSFNKNYLLLFCSFSSTDPALLNAFKLEMAYGFERFFLLSYCLACCWPQVQVSGEADGTKLRTVRQWAELDFQFPSEAARQDALAKRYYVPGYSVPIDVDVEHRRGMLVDCPSFFRYI